jgi:hypothetical protein
MKGRLMVGVALAALLVVGGVAAMGLPAAQATDGPTPDAVVSGFYEWYLDYIGEAGERRNPLVDRAYRTSEFLSEGFVAKVDEQLASAEHFLGDPFLMAQDVPVKVEVGAAEVEGDEASVLVEMTWGGNPVPSKRMVNLVRVDGEWRIDQVTMAD